MESNAIMLSEEQREELKSFANKGVHSAKEIRRAKVILALDRTDKKDHLRVGRICEALGVTRQGLCNIRAEFMAAADIPTFLARKKRETPPVPAKITGEIEAHIIALACTVPPKGHARWTVRLVANKAVELHYIDNISHTAVQLLLKKRNISLI
jgi:hypothetical protein